MSGSGYVVGTFWVICERTLRVFSKKYLMGVRATLPLQFLVLKLGLLGLQTIHARDNPHKG